MDFYNQLSETTQKIAALWRSEPATTFAWQKVEDLESTGLPDISEKGHTRPFWVSCDYEGQTLYAVAKPLDTRGYRKDPLLKLTGNETPVMDKIAFDLAYDLGLPVAPAALWTDDEDNQFVLSLKPYDSVITPAQIRDTLGTAEMEVRLLNHLQVLTAASVFNIFIGQPDTHPDNLLLNAASETDTPVLIDFDTAFQKEVLRDNKPRTPGLADYFNHHTGTKVWGQDSILRAFIPKDAESMANKIYALENHILGNLVERIPDTFLSPSAKARVFDFFEQSFESFWDRFETRFGGDYADPRWPNQVFLSTRNPDVPQDLRWLLPKGEHLSQEEADKLRERHPALKNN